MIFMVPNNTIVRLRCRAELTLDAAATHAGMHPSLVRRFAELGLVHCVRHEDQTMFFDPAEILRLRTISRLPETLGITLPGVQVVLNLLDKIHPLQREDDAL